jgi:hypothetical protein
LKFINRVACAKPVGHVTFRWSVGKMNNADAPCHRRNEGCLLLRMAAPTVVIVGKDYDMAVGKIRFAASRQAVAGTAKGDGKQQLIRKRLNVSLSLRPPDRVIRYLTIKGIGIVEKRHWSELVWLSGLPTSAPIEINHAVPILGSAIPFHYLDMNRNAAILVEMSTLLVAPFWRTFVATNMEARFPVFVRLSAGWEGWLRETGVK